MLGYWYLSCVADFLCSLVISLNLSPVFLRGREHVCSYWFIYFLP